MGGGLEEIQDNTTAWLALLCACVSPCLHPGMQLCYSSPLFGCSLTRVFLIFLPFFSHFSPATLGRSYFPMFVGVVFWSKVRYLLSLSHPFSTA